MVRRFESDFASRFKIPYAISVNSATSGLIAALGACRLGPGDEVITTCMSFNATALSILAFNSIPILGRRLFIMFAGRDYLRNLRKIGFCTFDQVIDESYDNERGDMERFSMAMDQVRYLCSQPQEEILDIINPICNYNLEHLMRVDWYEDYFKTSFVQYFNQ